MCRPFLIPSPCPSVNLKPPAAFCTQNRVRQAVFARGLPPPFSGLLQDHTGTAFIRHLSGYLQISFPQPEEFQHLSIRAVDKGVVYLEYLRLCWKVYILRRNFACSAML